MGTENANIGEPMSKDQEAMERIATEREMRIVEFVNIDEEQFEHAFRGIKISVGAGKKLACSLPQAEHLALHLSRKMLGRKVRAQIKAAGRAGATRQDHLWEPEQVEELSKQMIISLGAEQEPQTA